VTSGRRPDIPRASGEPLEPPEPGREAPPGGQGLAKGPESPIFVPLDIPKKEDRTTIMAAPKDTGTQSPPEQGKARESRAADAPASAERPFEPFSDCRIVLLDLDPRRAFAYWDVDQRALDEARRRARDSRAPEVIRCWAWPSVEAGASPGREAPPPGVPSFDIVVQSARGNYYIELQHPGQTLAAELGVRGSNGRFAVVARSNIVTLPRDSESLHYDDRRRRVSGLPSPLWAPRRTPPEALRTGWGADAALSTGSADDASPLAVEADAGASPASSAGTGSAASVQTARGAPTEALPATGEEWAAASRVPASAFEAAEIGATLHEGIDTEPPMEAVASAWSGSVASESRPRSAPRAKLEIHADIVVYGRAPPGTEVLIDGLPVEVRSDGTFDLRFALPAAGRRARAEESTSSGPAS